MPAPIMAIMTTSVTPARTRTSRPGRGETLSDERGAPGRRGGASGRLRLPTLGRGGGRAVPWQACAPRCRRASPRQRSSPLPPRASVPPWTRHRRPYPWPRPNLPPALRRAAARAPDGPGSSGRSACSWWPPACSPSSIELPYYTIAPGSARPTEPTISVEGAETFPAGDDLLFTTVTISQDRINGFEWLQAELSPDVDLVRRRPDRRRPDARGEPAAQPAADGQLRGHRRRGRAGAPRLRRGLRYRRNRGRHRSRRHRPTGSSTPATRWCGRADSRSTGSKTSWPRSRSSLRATS